MTEELLKQIEIYKKTCKRLLAYQYAYKIIGWDSETVAPKNCFEYRSKQLGILTEEVLRIQTSEEYVNAINYIYEHKNELDDKILAHEIVEVKEENDKTLKVPMQEQINASILFAKSANIWKNAKYNNNFKEFESTLKEIVDYEKKYAKYNENETLKGYDVLLDSYEKGMTTKEYDKFFGVLKEKLVPFVKKVLAKQNTYDFSFAKKKYKIDDQKKVCEYFRDVMCFDKNSGIMMESEHPFTNGIGVCDARVTNHYFENDFLSSIFSVIHETGHATYELGLDESLVDTFSYRACSMAMHESQSRFYENIVCRDEAFLKRHFPYLQSVFKKQLKNVDFDTFYHYVNKVEASFIRTDADELTYPLHVMLRYDLEKKLFNGEIEVKDLEKEWNKLFYEYLGLKVKKASQGVLQDIHWSDGSFGYFPTYALGSAYGAQMLKAMKKDIDFEKEVGSDNLSKINKWLNSHIHHYASTLDPKDLLKQATGEEFNPNYYIDYLIEKYSKIYGIK